MACRCRENHTGSRKEKSEDGSELHGRLNESLAERKDGGDEQNEVKQEAKKEKRGRERQVLRKDSGWLCFITGEFAALYTLFV